MNENWLKVVSFKTELLSEAVIHRGYRESIPKLLPELPPFRNRMTIDNDIYIDLNETNQIQKYLADNIINKAQRIYSVIEEQSNKLLSITDDIENFLNEYQKTIGLIGIPTIIDLELERQLKNVLQNEIDNPGEFISGIAIPHKSLGTFEEKEGLLDMAINISKNDLAIDSKEVEKFIFEHQKQYGWIHSTLFLSDEYSVSDIKREVEKILEKDPAKEKEDLKNRRKRNLDKISQKVSSLKAEKAIQLSEFFQEIVYYRTARLEWMNKACFKIKPELTKLADALNVSFDEVIYLLPDELVTALKSGKLSHGVRTKISKRMDKYAYVSDNENEYLLLVGEEVDEWEKKHREKLEGCAEMIKGISASKGIVTGKVVVVKDRSELSKVEDGDVLVTALTTPDFVAAMKKSVATVTDLGGITSHAAITSRELQKPCIVGTKHATQVLNDGDEVEVDAERGIVTMIKKANEE